MQHATVELEAQLRHAVKAPQECGVDDIFDGDQVEYSDASFLGTFQMRCPLRLIYGGHGGCEACKCTVPTFDEVKRYCPVYGKAGVTTAPRSPWELKESLESVMAKATTLVIISGQEDISMSEDAPSKMALYAYQASLIDKAAVAGVPFVLLIGPSDDPPRGAKEATRELMRDAKMVQGLERRTSAFEGFASIEEAEKQTMPRLVAEEALGHHSVNYKTLRV
ncbi:hypothetical protein T484DRAFT_1892447, partial [Baffinella frigidus]